MMPTWKKPSSVSQRLRRMSACGWKPRVCKHELLPWLLLLHVSLLLPHKVPSAVDPRGSGAMIPDACVLTAADEQLLQASRPAAERAVRQAALHMAPAAMQRGSKSMSRRRLCWSRRRGMPQLHRQQRKVGTRPCKTISSAHIVELVEGTNDA